MASWRNALNPLEEVNVLFGGCTHVTPRQLLPTDPPGQVCDQFSDQTWEFDPITNNWYVCTTACATNRPPARMVGGQISQTPRGDVVLFGGNRGLAFSDKLNDTWTWNGSHWTCNIRGNSGFAGTCNAASGPAGLTRRSGGGMARIPCAPPCSSSDERVALYAGGEDPNNLSRQTWLWNELTESWTEGPQGPPARQSFGMATQINPFASTTHRVIMYGGVGNGGAYVSKSDTWQLTGP